MHRQHVTGDVEPVVPATGVEVLAKLEFILADPAISGIQWMGSKHDNPSRAGLVRASGVIVLNDPQTNYPIAILEASLIRAWRTAAVTCLGAAKLARQGFTDSAVIALRRHRAHPDPRAAPAVQRYRDPPRLRPRPRRRASLRQRPQRPAPQGHHAGGQQRGGPDTARRRRRPVHGDRPALHPIRLAQTRRFRQQVPIRDVHEDVFLNADKVVVADWEQSNREQKIINQLVLEVLSRTATRRARRGAERATPRPGQRRRDHRAEPDGYGGGGYRLRSRRCTRAPGANRSVPGWTCNDREQP
jgi:hypothetical protein